MKTQTRTTSKIQSYSREWIHWLCDSLFFLAKHLFFCECMAILLMPLFDSS